MQLNYIYIDANPVDRLYFLQLLKKFPELNLKKEFSDAVHALEYLNYNSVDFVIVTAELPIYNGFEFAKQLKEKIEIVLLTKKTEDAVKSFEEDFVDCLIKPVKFDRFNKTVRKIEDKIEYKRNLVTKKEYTIHFKCNFKTEKVSANNIRWIEAMGDYVKIVTSKKTYMVLSTMKSFLDKLPHGQFVRIHKSYIINLNKVINFTTNTVNTDGKCLPLSRKQKGEFKETYLNFQ
ncbi:MAG: DNA-binding response regulator [Flavobacteriales bacterium MED-G15]|nr:MAG: DNA-binding response regulator [Flavobacteriales bacterium MED-G15]|tara:strand:- start:23409 stop:24107 length:699 start_codon:yes stop_codon:yes gene_type:complete